MSPLPVVVPYFNHTNAGVNRRNLEQCLLHLSITPECRVVLVEGIWNREAELPDFSQRIFRHLKFDLQSPIWVKENLINLGIASLGEDWECAAWIDKDNQFLNPDWPVRTMERLEECDILQPWSRVLFLGADGEVDTDVGKIPAIRALGYQSLDEHKGIKSFCHAHHVSGEKGWFGQAWAISKPFYRRIGKLFDLCINGGGDGLLAASIAQSRERPNHLFFGDLFDRYADAFLGVKTGWVEGTLIHRYHGDMNPRNYLGRYDILTEARYDPLSDTSYSENGTLTIDNPELEKAIYEYFLSRNEHLVE